MLTLRNNVVTLLPTGSRGVVDEKRMSNAVGAFAIRSAFVRFVKQEPGCRNDGGNTIRALLSRDLKDLAFQRPGPTSVVAVDRSRSVYNRHHTRGICRRNRDRARHVGAGRDIITCTDVPDAQLTGVFAVENHKR